MIAEEKGVGYANACQVWRGAGDLGQRPLGWWMRPFNGKASFLGRNWTEAQTFFEDYTEYMILQ